MKSAFLGTPFDSSSSQFVHPILPTKATSSLQGPAKVALAVMMGFSLTNCSVDTADSKDVNEKKIHNYHRVNYSEEDSMLVISSQFRFGGPTGTTIHLTDPSKITVNNEPMVFQDGMKALVNVAGSYYYLEKKNPTLESSYLFQWQQQSGKALSYMVQMAPAVHLVELSNNQKIDLNDTLTIKINETADQSADVSIHCTIHSNEKPSQENAVDPYASTLAVGGKCRFSPEDLKDMPAGSASVYVASKWESNMSATNDDNGAALSSSYRSKEIKVTFVK